MKSLVLIGNGGHSKSCIEIIETSKEFKIKGIVVHPDDQTKKFMNYQVIGDDENLNECINKNDQALICIGQIKSPKKRIILFDLLIKNKISLATIKSKKSIISKYASVGHGSCVMHNVVINAGAKVGANCILNTNSLIEHDTIIGNHCHVSTGAIINGAVEIGNGCFLGSGVVIREGVKIGAGSIISAGQIVMNDVPPATIYKN